MKHYIISPSITRKQTVSNSLGITFPDYKYDDKEAAMHQYNDLKGMLREMFAGKIIDVKEYTPLGSIIAGCAIERDDISISLFIHEHYEEEELVDIALTSAVEYNKEIDNSMTTDQ